MLADAPKIELSDVQLTVMRALWQRGQTTTYAGAAVCAVSRKAWLAMVLRPSTPSA